MEITRRAAVVDELRVENEASKIRRKAKQVEFAERASPASACRAIVVKFRAEGEKEGRRRMRLKKRVHSIEIAWLSVLIAACIATLIGFIVACVVQGDDIKVSDARKLRQRILSHTSAPTHAPLGHNAC